jgi:uncharacterized LabA/DUF88 family protein
MALNITPRRPGGSATTTAVADAQAPDDSKKTDETVASKTPARTRRTSRSRSTSTRSTARTRATETDNDASEAQVAKQSATSRRSTARKAEEPEAGAEKTPSTRRRTRGRAENDKSSDDAKSGTAHSDELERQRRTIDRLTRDVDDLKKLQRELIEKLDRVDGARPGVALQRVGVFVDVANVELAADKLSRRLDWTKVLKKLTKDRQLIRAVAYSPVHEDINVSLESQRFTEPFVDRGYRLVTKPLKKFSDGTVKANVDIEMTVEILEMLDRLDIVCLVSGDGDFEPLVKTIQSKGIRVEVVSIGAATAMALKRACDKFIDLGAILNEVS